jgi:small-conductance mechanosensitive channel
VDRRFQVKHEINSMIAKAFYKAGITIPFPQRDLHIVSGSLAQNNQNSSNGSSVSKPTIDARVGKDIAADE